MNNLLDVKNLHVSFNRGAREIKVLRGLSFSIRKGEILSLVGESGSGKSVTAFSIMRLLPHPLAHYARGSILFQGKELIGTPEACMRDIRGNRIAMIFQEPSSSLNPLHSIGKQITEILRLHKRMTFQQAQQRAIELLHLVGLEEAKSRLHALPHEFSGGQQQRIMIAMALANEPDLLIADEPTTALDVTVQAQILRLLKKLQIKFRMAIMLITHDLDVARNMADRVCIIQNGEIIEHGSTAAMFKAPKHPYTQRLLATEPKSKNYSNHISDNAPIIMETKNIKVWFPVRRGIIRRTVSHIKAVDGISMKVRRGRTVGVVGESGSGKTTLGLALLRLERSEGSIIFHGHDIQDWKVKKLRPLRREMQIVFQDPFASLNPRLSVFQIIEEGLKAHDLGDSYKKRRQLVAQALEEVGIDPKKSIDHYPHEFSGGQRQRISIARSLVLRPSFMVLDEPTSALDMSIQAQVIELLRSLQRKYSLAYLFISHDLKVVRALSHDVIVMHAGTVVEQGPTRQIFTNPKHPYTQVLISAAVAMKINENRIIIP